VTLCAAADDLDLRGLGYQAVVRVEQAGLRGDRGPAPVDRDGNRVHSPPVTGRNN
jgi:hypothetical protein